jgi:hypothetical protein
LQATAVLFQCLDIGNPLVWDSATERNSNVEHVVPVISFLGLPTGKFIKPVFDAPQILAIDLLNRNIHDNHAWYADALQPLSVIDIVFRVDVGSELAEQLTSGDGVMWAELEKPTVVQRKIDFRPFGYNRLGYGFVEQPF